MVSFVARFDLSHVLFIFLIFFPAHLRPTPQSRRHACIHFGRMTFRERFQYTFLNILSRTVKDATCPERFIRRGNIQGVGKIMEN
jgi:hypothetical protein